MRLPRPPVSPRSVLAAAGILAVVAGGAAAWEIDRRRRAGAVAADPEAATLAHPVPGRSLSVTSRDGTTLNVRLVGQENAPTIVLVHGWTCAIDFWHYQLRDLAPRWRVVAYDQRGHGGSARPRGGAYTADALADDLEAVLDACLAPGERCVVAGHSMGGMTIVAWAGRHPEGVLRRLAAAALLSTGMGDLVRQALVLRLPLTAAVREAIAPRALGIPLPLVTSSTPVAGRLIRSLVMSPAASPARVAFCERLVAACPAPVRAGFGWSLSTLDLYTAVPHLAVPTLVAVGTRDRLTPAWHAERLAEALPDVAELLEIEGVGHMTPIEAPEVITGRLDALLATHLAAGAGGAAAAGQARRK